MRVKLTWFLSIFCFLNLCVFPVLAAEVSFTLEDRDRLVRLETTIQEFKDTVDKRFDQVDKRFSELREDMNKRFEEMFNFMYILSGIFTALVIFLIGLLFWDRRTIIKEARREAIEFMEKEG